MSSPNDIIFFLSLLQSQKDNFQKTAKDVLNINIIIDFFYTCQKNIPINVTFKTFYSFFLFSLEEKKEQ